MPRMVLGLRVLQGDERRDLQRSVAIERATFEREYAGKPVVPFDREQVSRMARRRAGTNDIYISDGFVRETQRRLPWAHRLLEEED